MKFMFIILAVIATTYAAFPFNEYLSPLEDDFPTSLRLRHRRDVSELPLSEYLPPTQAATPVADFPVIIDIPVEKEQKQNTAVLADDGYHYKTIKRIRYRHRRDINELPSTVYLPSTQEQADPVAAVEEVVSIITLPEKSAILTDDGYQYKTVKRIRYRHRRDVSELSSNDYLPQVHK